MAEKITIEGLKKRGWGQDVLVREHWFHEDAPACYLYVSNAVAYSPPQVVWDMGAVRVETIEELYRTLEFFGLIEPEPITAEGLERDGWELADFDKESGYFQFFKPLKSSQVYVEIRRTSVRVSVFENSVFGENKVEPEGVKSMHDLREFVRLMGVKYETSL